ncbi:hypothetical protein MRX96_003001 [Rhipicephalus microplus]
MALSVSFDDGGHGARCVAANLFFDSGGHGVRSRASRQRRASWTSERRDLSWCAPSSSLDFLSDYPGFVTMTKKGKNKGPHINTSAQPSKPVTTNPVAISECLRPTPHQPRAVQC